MKKSLKWISTLVMFGIIYVLIEVVYKGGFEYATWQMAVLGGICATFVSALNNIFTYEMDFALQCTVGAIFTTIGEGIFGVFCNVNYPVEYIWNYNDLPFTFWGGNCNLFFSFAWFLLCGIAIIVQDYIDYKLCGEEKPYYKVFGKVVFRIGK